MSTNPCPCDRCGCDDAQTSLYNLNDNGNTYTATFCTSCESYYEHLIVDADNDDDDVSVAESEDEDPQPCECEDEDPN